MKNIGIGAFNLFLHFKKNNGTNRTISYLLVLAVLNLSTSCSYYKVKDIQIDKDQLAQQIQTFNAARNYAIINKTWHLENLVVNDDERTMSGTVQALWTEHSYEKIRESKKTHRYKKDEKQPLNELYFTVTMAKSPMAGESLTIPFENITAISVNDKNTGRTVLNIAAGTIGAFFATMLIIVALKSSCPFVYVKDGTAYVFQGELYPGIITANLQRLDYLQLPDIQTEAGQLILKVTNELREVQYTDMLQLWIIEHEAGELVVLDKNGRPQFFSNLHPPVSAIDENHREVGQQIGMKDNIFHNFNDDLNNTTSTRKLELKFKRPKGSQKAKLLLTAKNSLWLDYVFGRFNAQFGAYYNQFQKDQQQVSAAQGQQWAIDQHIPLSVSIKTDKGWETIDRINTVGPMATRDIAVPIDLGDISGDSVEVRLEAGFMFWDLDYAAIDFSEDRPYEITKLKPISAFDQNDRDVASLLASGDGQYFVQPEVGDQVEVRFVSPQMNPEKLRATFLVNKGYYNYIRNYEGIPDFERLKKFRNKNTFTRYSENAYKEIMAIDRPENASL